MLPRVTSGSRGQARVCGPLSPCSKINRIPEKWASLVAQLVKDPPAMRETWVLSLIWADALEKETAMHSSILAWRIPWTVESMGSQRIGHD